MMNIRAVFEPPVNAVTVSIAGSFMIILTIALNFFSIAWNEMSWEAWIFPLKRPVSCWGNKPVGMIRNKIMVVTSAASVKAQHDPLMPQGP